MDPVEEIKRRLDVSEVVGSYIQLKPAGRNHKALCPFHHEKTPSLMVSDDKGIWHCFGCSEGGDIFSFVQKMDGLEFTGALETLARRAGVNLEDKQRGPSSEIKERAYQANELATKYYQAVLARSPAAQAYLKKRGFSAKTIGAFRLGYAPSGGANLVKALKNKGVKDQILTRAGLTRQSGQNLQDLFRARLIIPLADQMGRIIGFTGRVLDDGLPKYLNTPQTLLFDKSRHLFGLDLAKEAIRESDNIVIVEGHLDAVTSHEAGVKQVVASGGTALTTSQLKLASRLTKNVKLAFDQDAAGLSATERAIPLAQNLGISLYIIGLGRTKDPDELIRGSGGVSQWRTAITQAPYVMDWLLMELPRQYDLSTALGKKRLTDRLSASLSRLSDPVEQEHYIDKVAAIVGVKAETINRKLEPADDKAEHVDRRAVYVAEPLHDESRAVEEELLALAVSFADTRTSLQDLAPEHFDAQERVQIFKWLKANHQTGLNKELPKPLADIADYVKILQLKGEEGYEEWAPLDRRIEAFSLATRLGDIKIKKQRARINQDLKAAEAAGDEKRRLELLRQFRDLSRQT